MICCVASGVGAGSPGRNPTFLPEPLTLNPNKTRKLLNPTPTCAQCSRFLEATLDGQVVPMIQKSSPVMNSEGP